MMGVIAGHDMTVRMTGDASLSRRPMGRVLKPLLRMGLEVVDRGKETLPLTLRGSPDLIPIEYQLPVPSAQIKSAVLIAGLHAAGETTVIEPEATRDHTERMLGHFGAQLTVTKRHGVRAISIKGDAELVGQDVRVPGDPSSAAFLAAAALIVPGSEVTIGGVLVNPTRTGFYATLSEMGGDVAFLNERNEGGEPVADIRVRHSRLKGVHVPAARAPAMIDEYPVLACLAAYADGETRMDGLGELKVKESDRLAATADGSAGQWRCGQGRRRHAGGRRRQGRARRRHGRHPPRPPHRHGLSHTRARRRSPGDRRRRRHDRHQLPRVPPAHGRPGRELRRTPGRGPMIVAIDGPAASGKGTLAKRIAVHFGLPYLDTGLLYRAVARDVRARGGALDDPAAAAAAARTLDPASLDDPDLRGYGIGEAASIVGAHPRRCGPRC